MKEVIENVEFLAHIRALFADETKTRSEAIENIWSLVRTKDSKLI